MNRHGHFGQALNVLVDFAQENQHWAHGNCVMNKVSLLGVDSLWGDYTFIPADWGS